jgi:hypothetical protein
MQGNNLRRELVLTKDSAIAPNLDQYHVLGELDEVLGSKIKAHVAPEVITLTTTVSAPLAIPANVSVVTPANEINIVAIKFDAVDHLVVPLPTTAIPAPTVTPAAVLPSRNKKVSLGSLVTFKESSVRFVYYLIYQSIISNGSFSLPHIRITNQRNNVHNTDKNSITLDL